MEVAVNMIRWFVIGLPHSYVLARYDVVQVASEWRQRCDAHAMLVPNTFPLPGMIYLSRSMLTKIGHAIRLASPAR